MSSLKITPGGVCGIGFVSSGSSALVVVAHVINENGLFTASLVFSFLVLWCAYFGLGLEGNVWLFLQCVLPSCCCLLVLVATGKMVALTLGNPATSDRGFYFPVLHTASLIFLFFYNGAYS